MNLAINSVAALILAAGDDVPRQPPPGIGENTLIICADGGGQLARRWGLQPQIIIGDLDSLGEGDQNYWRNRGVSFKTAPARKDQTDVELAVDYALNRGAARITLIGGWGSRIDHSLGNVELLYRLALLGVENQLLTSTHVLSAFCGSVRRRVRPRSLVSLVPLTPVVRGVATEGLGYPLKGHDLHKGSTFSISNYAVRGEVSVEIAQGVLLIVCQA